MVIILLLLYPMFLKDCCMDSGLNKLVNIFSPNNLSETDGNIGIVSKTPIPRAVVSVSVSIGAFLGSRVSVSISVEPPAPVFGSYATIPY